MLQLRLSDVLLSFWYSNCILLHFNPISTPFSPFFLMIMMWWLRTKYIHRPEISSSFVFTIYYNFIYCRVRSQPLNIIQMNLRMNCWKPLLILLLLILRFRIDLIPSLVSSLWNALFMDNFPAFERTAKEPLHTNGLSSDTLTEECLKPSYLTTQRSSKNVS